MKERLPITERYDSMRGWFAYEVYNRMLEDSRIWVVSIDLGYRMWDRVREDIPVWFITTGAAEQAALGIAVGLAKEG